LAYLEDTKPLKLGDIARMRAAGEKIAMLTSYDASFAAMLDRCGVDVVLVGDSLGNVVQGHPTTLTVTLQHMIYHTDCVFRGMKRGFLIADMPFGTYQESPSQAMRNAAQLMSTGAQMVKLEGGAYMAETVHFLVERGIPVCAHIGLTPQAVHQLGGYRVQGKGDAAAARMKADALALEQAGAAMMVIEMTPTEVATEITRSLTSCATIGIGAGPNCDGQVLVLHDMIGVFPGKRPRFVKDFIPETGTIEGAVKAYVAAVKNWEFPAPEHGY
jgi:3-methyl-2-oxobutanoate hydroxymethyltransferase